MRKAMRRAMITLALAGTVGAGMPLRAQPSLFPPASAVERASVVDAGKKVETVDPAAARAVEIAVELAFLADRTTSPYRLSGRCTGDKLEVRGFVPTEVVRRRVIEIACDASNLDVIDSLRLHPQLAANVVGVLPEQIKAEAREALAEGFPECERKLTLQVASSGEVTVLGWSPTLETKLAISRCLREVRGCTAVINQVKLSAKIMQESAPYLNSSAAPRTITLGPNVEPVGPTEGPELTAAPVAAAAAQPPASATKETPSALAPPPATAPASRRSTSAYGAETKAKDPWVPDPNLLPAHPALVPIEDKPPEREAILTPEPREPAAKAAVSAPVTVPLALPPVIWPNKEPTATKQDDPSADSLDEVGPSGSRAPDLLDPSITRACGPRARNLEIVPTGPQCLTVRMKVSTRDEGEQISQRIFALHELKAYRVKLEIKIAR